MGGRTINDGPLPERGDLIPDGGSSVIRLAAVTDAVTFPDAAAVARATDALLFLSTHSWVATVAGSPARST